jgi:HD-like signal output (HDOD) protein/AmiR/NasT family two-component response regulator
MSQAVVIANRHLHEAKAIAAVLAGAYDAHPVTDAAALPGLVENAMAVVLDTNFSEAQGIDVLMDVLGRVQVPVVMVTPEDHPACALEAIRCGAASYLVKTASYAELLPTPVQDAIHRSRAIDALKRELLDLRKRNTALEKALKEARIQASLGVTGKMLNPDSTEVRMEEIIAERIRSGTLQLPAYPRIAIKLKQLLQHDVGISEVAQLLSQDAAISAKLLRAANAAQYGNLRAVESVEGAVSRLGLAAACNMAELVANRSLYSSRNAAWRGLLEELWIHSIAVAHASVAIARQVGKSAPQSLFALGLLHDSGRLALMQAVSQVDPEGKCIENGDKRKWFFEFLRKHNVTCGVVLLQCWGFGKDYEDAVRYNYNLDDVENPTRSLLIINLANTLARAIGYGNPLESPDELEKSPAKGFLFPGDADLSPVIDNVHAAVEDTRKALA